MEQELEVQLFVRNNKSVLLTDAGLYFKKEVDAIFAKLEESEHAIRKIQVSAIDQKLVDRQELTDHIKNSPFIFSKRICA